ncbi:MAG: hypothetical protein WC878_02190 [Candidatus Paceibacterota bacterium]|jgi:hypothetical protein
MEYAGSILILTLLLLAVGILCEKTIDRFFGPCPKCSRRGVSTTVEDTGPDSSYPNTNHFFVREACRYCGWHHGRDVNSRPDKWDLPPPDKGET